MPKNRTDAALPSNTCGERPADVVIMLDRSGSIDRETELPYEAAAAKTLLDSFAALGVGHRAAIGAFSSTATILPGAHLTADYDALKTAIDEELDGPPLGTNLEDAVQVSANELEADTASLRFIILISDGAVTRRNTAALANDEAALLAAQNAKNRGIRILTIAYDAASGTRVAVAGRALLAAMAGNASVDDTAGAVDDAERDLENGDGDDFYVAPSVTDLNGIFEGIGESIFCDDGDDCTSDTCEESTRSCVYVPVDFDADGTLDCRDACPNDATKTEPGQCDCNAPENDSDADGTADCADLCPADRDKSIPGLCGCGINDEDSDADGIADCNDDCVPGSDSDADGTPDCGDACPLDPFKIAPGQCGCGEPDVDADLDGIAACADACADDPAKSVPGTCGCRISDADTDGDGTANCNDQCPEDSDKIVPGACGCGENDADTNGDGFADCPDLCPEDPLKILPGLCGCGVPDTDADSDATPDCNDVCANDAGKTLPGFCGCGVFDADSDGDGGPDCQDACPNDAGKTDPGSCGCGLPETETCVDSCPFDNGKSQPGVCGCGTSDADTDADGTPNCSDQCPVDPGKSRFGVCGCNMADVDFDQDGLADCVDPCPFDPDNDADRDGICDDSVTVSPEPPSAPTPTPSSGGVVCDVTLDADGDGLPDDLDPTLDDSDGDGIPDCCTSGNAESDLLGFDSDEDGVPDCREFILGTDPMADDIGFQGSATDMSFSKCSLSELAGAGASDPFSRSLAGMLFTLCALRILKGVKNRRELPLRVAFLCFALTGQALALDVQKFSPADASGSGFGLFTSRVLPTGSLSAGAFFNYAHHPFELGRIDNDPRVFGIVDRFATANLVATVGVFKGIEATVGLPVNLYHDIAPTLIPNRNRGGPDLGDLRLSAKIGFLNAEVSSGRWGLALAPFLTFPTGKNAVFFGNDGTTGGLVAVGEKIIGRGRLYANLGVEFRKRERLGNLVVNDAFLYGAGYRHLFSDSHGLSGIFEVQGSTKIEKIWQEEITSPAEIRAILQKNWSAKRDLRTYVGAGAGITNGYGSPDFRVFTGISVTFDLKKPGN